MWAIRVLSGQQAGQFFALKPGSNVLGRAPSCDIKILSPNVSKEHAKIEVLEGKMIVSDLGSRNGTFVNGTQYRSTKVRPGDRIGLHDVIIEIVPLSAMTQRVQAAPNVNAPRAPWTNPPPTAYGNVAYQMPPPAAHGEAPAPAADAAMPAFANFAKDYVDRVVMPGVYRLAEIIEFRTLLALFMTAFVLLVTSLSTIPLIRILRDSVEEQSQQHALTIAATLARVNEAAIREGMYTAINMTTAQRAGVTDALIVSKVDGKIIAPASRAESSADIPFVHEARNFDRDDVRQINSNTVVAVYPISTYDPETGSRRTLAFSVVKYDMASLAVDDSKTISLFVITLFIAAILGTILFFFLYRLVEYPINSLNVQLDAALKEGRDDLKTTFLFDPLARLTSNINSALSRAVVGGGAASAAANRQFEHDRRPEMSNLVEMVGFPALIVSAFDRTVAAMNPGFEERTRLDPMRTLNQPVSLIADQALKLSLIDLMDRLEQNPDQLVNNEIEFGGNAFQLVAQAIYGSAKVAYYLIILVPQGGEG